MKLQRRAAFGWGPSGADWANPTRGIAVHYEGSNTGIASFAHAECIRHWRKTRTFHMGPSRGWADIGYSFGVCPHYALEGRGKDRVQAAQPGGNATWYSVTFMTGPNEKPHPNQVINFRQLRAWLMKDDVASAIRPHSSFVNTGCPGAILRGMIRDGSLIRGVTEGVNPMSDVFCKKGQEGPAVGKLQVRLHALGWYEGEIDQKYGPKTAAGVLAMRKDEGSTAESGDHYGFWADWQLDRALFKALVPKYQEKVTAPDSPTVVDGLALPANVRIEGAVRLSE